MGVIVMVGLAVDGHTWRQHNPEQRLIAAAVRELTALFGVNRPLEARLAYDVAYRPVIADRGTSKHDVKPSAVLAASRLREVWQAGRTPTAAAALGAAYLLMKEPAEAVSVLQAEGAALADATVSTNLSAAYFSRREPGDLVRALDRGLGAAHQGRANVARFNVALAGERLFAVDEAERLWAEAIAAEPVEAWRGEARVYRAALSAEGEREAASLPGLYAALLAADERVPDICAGPDRQASASLHSSLQARAATTSRYAALSPNQFPADLLRWLKDGAASCEAPRVRALTAFVAARRSYNEDRFSEALARLAAVSDDLRRLRSPLLPEADILRATCLYTLGRRGEAERLLVSARTVARRLRYMALVARAEWLYGYMRQDQNHFDLAHAAYGAAAPAFAAAGDLAGEAAMLVLSASVHDALGQYEEGWRSRERGLALLRHAGHVRSTFPVLLSSARAAHRDGLALAAQALAQAALREARRERSDLRIAEAMILAAEAALQADDRASAIALIREARPHVSNVDAIGVRERARARLVVGEARLTTDFATRRDRLTEAIDAYSTATSRLLVARLLLARGGAHEGLGDAGRAQADYQRGIAVFEQARGELRDSTRRIDYSEEAWGLFNALVALHIKRGQPAEAFAAAERGRALEIRDALRLRPVQLSELSRQLGPRTTLLYYVMLPDEIVVWAVSRDGWRVARQPIARERLESAIADLRALTTARDERDDVWRRAAERGWHLLIQPVAHLLRPGDRLLMAPQGRLASVPFAALRNAASGRYLIEDYELASVAFVGAARDDAAPSSRVPGTASSAASTATAAPRAVARPAGTSVLVVDASSASPDDRLPGLPNARREAQAVAAIHGGAQVADGPRLGAARVAEELSRYAIVHFAGHAVISPDTPNLSRLVVAPATPSDAALYAFQLERLDFSGVRLVVLAACETAAGRTYQSEGVASLARAILSRGAGSVTATLWALDDRASFALLTSFHHGVRDGHDAVSALRTAQLEMLRRDRSPASLRTWAGAVVVVRTLEQESSR